MRTLLRSALVLVALSLAACAAPAPEASSEPPAAPAPEKASPKQASATPIQPLSKKKFGGSVTETNTTPLDTLVKEPSRFNEKTVRTEGVVSAVCQRMGCWMEIADASGQAHIRMAGHSFFVPKDSKGHRAVVQGKVINGAPEVCGAADGCRGEAQAATGQIAKVELEATAIEFLD